MSALNEVEIPDDRDVSLFLSGNEAQIAVDGELVQFQESDGGDMYDVMFEGNYAQVGGLTEAATVLERWLEA